jgi:hypothetical protein
MLLIIKQLFFGQDKVGLFFLQKLNLSFDVWVDIIEDIFTVHDLWNCIVLPLWIFQLKVLLGGEEEDSWSAHFFLDFFKSFDLLFFLLLQN